MDLIVSLFSGDSVDVLAKKIYCIQSLRQNIWKLFISQLEDDSKYSTQRRASYLSDTGYSALVSFDWTSVVREMVDFNPLLLLTSYFRIHKCKKATKCWSLQTDCTWVWPCIWNSNEEEISGHVPYSEIHLSCTGKWKSTSKGDKNLKHLIMFKQIFFILKKIDSYYLAAFVWKVLADSLKLDN